MHGRETSYDLRLILERAARARAKGQGRRALRLYRLALATDRSSVEVHEKLAPLLAAAGQDFDAWNSYRALAHAALRAGRDDRAIAVYREACQGLPREIQAWQGLARLLVRQSEDAAAVEALVEGSRQFRSHWKRPEAIHLLRRARSIAPWHFEVVIELAAHLARADQKDEARMLLDGLANRCEPHQLPRLRAAQLAVSPGPRSLWSWLCSALQRPEPVPPRAREAALVSDGAEPGAPDSLASGTEPGRRVPLRAIGPPAERRPARDATDLATRAG